MPEALASTSSVRPSNTQSSTVRQNSDAKEAQDAKDIESTKKSAQSQERTMRADLNQKILQSSLTVSIQSGEKSQELLFRSAIDKLNELLAPDLGENAIQNAAANQDNSPEATAGRIVSISTGMFELYAKQHPDEDKDQLATKFVDLIRGGFEKGFKEASDVLQGLGVLNGDVQSGIQKTYELVQKGFNDFLEKQQTKTESDTAA